MTVAIRPARKSESRRAAVAVETTDGSTITWDELFSDFAPALISYARSRGISAPEDLVQDVLVTTVEKVSLFKGDRSRLRSWLFSITHRRIADEHRRFYRRPELLVGVHSQALDPRTSVDDMIEHAESAIEAYAALDVLRDRERAVIEMRIIEELSPGETAQRLGISEGNVRVIQSRALVKVRKHLNSGRGGLSGFALMPVLYTRYLGSRMPTDDVLGPWIDGLRMVASSGLVSGAGAPGLLAVAEGAAAAGGAGSAGLVVSSVVKISLVVSLCAAPVVIAGAVGPFDDSGAPWRSRHPVPVDFETGHLPVDDRPTSSGSQQTDTAPDGAGPAKPTPGANPSEVAEEAAPTTYTSPSDVGGDVPASPSDEGEPLADVSGSSADELVEPVTEDVVQPLVTDTLDTVDETLDAVDGGVGEIEDDVVEPVVNDAVGPLVEDSVDAVDETLGNLVEPTGDTSGGGLQDDPSSGLGPLGD